ncbi:hydantoinase/oxoprolinase N-terminal domain-containing protein [Brevibacillus centrosporus]|uniref:hydantoinase/oxoprolinase N-terminal domain-containing protein n=1 Tax=Brevibacillus centrosporus TaxID=54910 RepID=UPI0039865486
MAYIVLRLGIDINSKTTTGIVMNRDGSILHVAKSPTQNDFLVGLSEVIKEITAPDKSCTSIGEVIIGTDYFANLLEKGERLSKVCSIRIGQAKNTIPPLYGASDSIQKAIEVTPFQLYGGHEMDGSSSLQPGKHDLETFLETIREEGINSFAITGAFSLVNPAHENIVEQWIREIVGDDCTVTKSHMLGSIGFLERENSSIFNAALSKTILRSVEGLQDLMHQNGLHAKIYFTQNDGSLLGYESALQYPIRTCGSRISNSFRGASLLTGLNDCVIVDICQSKASIGALERGFPKEKRRNMKMAGVPVSLQMSDVTNLIISEDRTADDDNLDAIYHAIQRFQPRFEPLPIVFVGDGSDRIFPSFKYPWSDVLHPAEFENVSAIGACIAQVSGAVDRIYWVDEEDRDKTIQIAKEEAIQAAIAEGASPKSVFVQRVEINPIAYMPTKAIRINVKAIGTLDFQHLR